MSFSENTNLKRVLFLGFQPLSNLLSKKEEKCEIFLPFLS